MRESTTIGYLRVSTEEQEHEKNKYDLLSFANSNNLGTIRFVEETISGWKTDWRERKIADVIDELSRGDNLIVSEISRLGRNVLQVLEMLTICREKGINVYAVKGNWRLDGSISGKIIATIFALVAEIESDLKSMRVKEALAARRRSGKPLGRPKGPGKSKLDEHEVEIKALLSTGSTQSYIATKYGCTGSTLTNWMRKRKISKQQLVETTLK